ncbi:MAG TPA: cysteine desulfurase DndA [Polyangiaceae bacterium]
MFPVYLDCNATTPLEPAVLDVVRRLMEVDFGNAGSRTHEYGATALRAVQVARDQVARVIGASREDVIFTSGATESNNLAVLGLAPYGEREGRRHVVTTAIEHKAVLEPVAYLGEHGFEVTIVSPTAGGWVDPDAIRQAMRTDTLLVSVMHANNETGVVQPIEQIATVLGDHPAYLHVDAAQGFGKDLHGLRADRIDMVSVSGHKLFAPKGIGALIARRRARRRPPIAPLIRGGGQERGMRAGTLPVMLLAGLGLACELAVRDAVSRRTRCEELRHQALAAFAPLDAAINGEPGRTLAHVLNVSFPGVDSEAAMVALKGIVALSNGSACTSHSYEPSHVLKAMGLDASRIAGALRFSWCHLTPTPDWEAIAARLRAIRASA